MLQIKPDREYTTETSPNKRIVEDRLMVKHYDDETKERSSDEPENVSEYATKYLDKFFSWGKEDE